MIKTFPPTEWQIFVDKESDIQRFEDLINQRGIFKDISLYGQFRSYDKIEDIVEGKLGYRYIFSFNSQSPILGSDITRVVNLFLETA